LGQKWPRLGKKVLIEQEWYRLGKRDFSERTKQLVRANERDHLFNCNRLISMKKLGAIKKDFIYKMVVKQTTNMLLASMTDNISVTLESLP